MKKRLIPVLSFILFNPLVFSSLYAQEDSEDPNYSEKKNIRLDLSVGFGKKSNLNTLQWVKFAGLDENRRFNLGGGFRLSNYNYSYVTKELRGNGESGFTAIRAKGNVLTLNVMAAAEYIWDNRFGLGANLDIAGFSLGSITPDSGGYSFSPKPGASADPGATPDEIGGEPTGANILLGPKRDQGTLNSEIYVVGKLKRRAWLKVGMSHIYSGLILTNPADRFGSYHNAFFIGIRFKY